MALGRTFGAALALRKRALARWWRWRASVADCATYRASNRARIAALPASIIAAGSRPSCLYRPG